MEEANPGKIPGQLRHLEQLAYGQSIECAPGDGNLHIAPLAALQVGDGLGSI
jgi:hypothetical protein